jgi:hypothetical protein
MQDMASLHIIILSFHCIDPAQIFLCGLFKIDNGESIIRFNIDHPMLWYHY